MLFTKICLKNWKIPECCHTHLRNETLSAAMWWAGVPILPPAPNFPCKLEHLLAGLDVDCHTQDETIVA